MPVIVWERTRALMSITSTVCFQGRDEQLVLSVEPEMIDRPCTPGVRLPPSSNQWTGRLGGGYPFCRAIEEISKRTAKHSRMMGGKSSRCL